MKLLNSHQFIAALLVVFSLASLAVAFSVPAPPPAHLKSEVVAILGYIPPPAPLWLKALLLVTVFLSAVNLLICLKGKSKVT